MKYRPEVDGLRALAVIPVILFHADFSVFAGGYVGVDIFFVISGYLITSIIIKELESKQFSIVNFYERRARRILPALFLVMLVCIPLSWALLISPDMQSFSQSLVAVSVFGSNILFWLTSGYFSTASELKPLLHTWSLSLEEQFYVIFPILMIALWKFRKYVVVTVLTLLAALSLFAAQWSVTQYPDASFYLLHTRAWELLIGSFVALYFFFAARPESNGRYVASTISQQFASLVGLVLILISIFTFDANTPFPSIYTLIPVLGTAFILLFATPDTLVGKLFCNRALVGIGLISYSAYLWHQPLFAYARHYYIGEPSVAIYLLLSVISIGLAYLSWKLIEAPFRNKTKISRAQVFAFSFVGSVFFIVIGLVGHFTQGNFFRTYDSQQQDLLVTMQQRGANQACWRELERGNNYSGACVIGSLASQSLDPASFALLGDSHAGALAASLGKIGDDVSAWGYNFSYTSCAPIFGIVPVAASQRYAHCVSIRDQYEELLKSGQLPRTLIVAARWGIYFDSTPFNNGVGGAEPHGHVEWTAVNDSYADVQLGVLEALSDTISLMLESGHRVILIDPVPEMGWDVPYRLQQLYARQGHLNPNDAAVSLSVYNERNESLLAFFDNLEDASNLVRVNVANLFCESERCYAHFDGRALYYDRDHVSEFGADLILEQVKDELFEHE